MTVFDSAGKLCSWAGLVPTNNESAGRKYSTRISKGGRYLKPFLVQIANAVVKSEKYPEFRNKYLKLKKRHGHREAIIAICRYLSQITGLYLPSPLKTRKLQSSSTRANRNTKS